MKVRRGISCKKCGGDEWYRRARGKKWEYRCVVCRKAWKTTYTERQPGRLLFDKARQRSKQRGITCTIALQDIDDVWPKDGLCPVLGLPLEVGAGRIHDTSPTLDRLDPTKGYVRGNIAVISHAANSAKRDFNVDEIERLAKWMRQHKQVRLNEEP